MLAPFFSCSIAQLIRSAPGLAEFTQFLPASPSVPINAGTIIAYFGVADVTQPVRALPWVLPHFPGLTGRSGCSAPRATRGPGWSPGQLGSRADRAPRGMPRGARGLGRQLVITLRHTTRQRGHSGERKCVSRAGAGRGGDREVCHQLSHVTGTEWPCPGTRGCCSPGRGGCLPEVHPPGHGPRGGAGCRGRPTPGAVPCSLCHQPGDRNGHHAPSALFTDSETRSPGRCL